MAVESEGMRRLGSLIRLKAEFEERYLILHRHTFPGVLARIRDSNIRNYSIFLRNGMLFAYYEYIGSDYTGDLDQIGADPVTRDWWRLTDPMQLPLETRKEGEWWAEMPELLHLEKDGPDHPISHAGTFRFAYEALAAIPGVLKTNALRDSLKGVCARTVSLFMKDERLYLYLESPGDDPEKHRPEWETGLSRFLESIAPGRSSAGWHLMQEVFHTD